jgi:hypothetical protein
MPSERDPATASEEGAGRASSLGGPVLAVGAFAAGAAVTLVAKRLLDARRKADRAGGELEAVGDGSKEDLATVLRRAALDVAVAATGQAAERLRSQGEQAAPADEPEPEAAESSSR